MAAITVPPGKWDGSLACSNSLIAARGDSAYAGFDVRLKVDVAADGSIAWKQETEALFELTTGRFDSRGRFTAEGDGRRKDELRPNPWRVSASGEYAAKARRIEGELQYSRLSDGAPSRNCRLTVELK